MAIDFISQAKTGLSALELKRLVGVRYPTAWLIRRKLIQAMVEREESDILGGAVQADDGYLGGELSGGAAGRGSEHKASFLAAVSVHADRYPGRAKLSSVSGFTREAVATRASAHLIPGSIVISDELSYFAGVCDAGCEHQTVAVGKRNPRGLPDFLWVNTVLGNVKTDFTGVDHAL